MSFKGSDTNQLFTHNLDLTSRFHLIKVLGQGSAGVVYKVRDLERGGQEVALKVLSDTFAFDENTIPRFREELEVCKRVNHPNLVQAYDLIEMGGSLAFTMEFIQGCDLGQLIGRDRFSFREIDQIMYQLLGAVQALHDIKILHRDIKLENIMLREDGTVKLSDLGLIKKLEAKGLTKPGILLGTPQYMPPEYIREGRFQIESDIYACGVVLYELLSGERRLGDKPGGAAIEHLLKTNFEFPRISLPAEGAKYVDILKSSLDQEPNKRFSSAEQMCQGFHPQELGNPENLRVKGPVSFSVKAPKQGRVDGNSIFMLVLIVLFLLVSFLAGLLIFKYSTQVSTNQNVKVDPTKS